MTRLELPDSARSILAEGRQAYIAVPSRNGPHVTPELYAWSGGRLWFAAASSTLKAKVLARDPFAGAVVTIAGRSIVLAGRCAVFDACDVRGMALQAHHLPEATRAVTSYALRNAADLVSFIGDAATGRLGHRLPPSRVLFALDPSQVAVVENDVVRMWAGWDGQDPADHAVTPSGGERAVAAFRGPVAVPGRWFPDERLLHVPGGLLSLLRIQPGRPFPISVVVDQYRSPGPAAKQGRLLRGEGCMRADEVGWIEVVPDTIVDWDGVETSSRPAG